MPVGRFEPRGRPGRSAGFSVIELLVVMAILLLLAGIAVPAYYDQRNKASDALAKADARAAQGAALKVGNANGGRYDGPGGVSVPNLVRADETLSGAELSVPVVNPDSFTVRVRSETSNTFDITRHGDGTSSLTCASADRGGCPADGTWD